MRIFSPPEDYLEKESLSENITEKEFAYIFAKKKGDLTPTIPIFKTRYATAGIAKIKGR